MNIGNRNIISYRRTLSLREKRSGTKLEKTSLRADVFQDLLVGHYVPIAPIFSGIEDKCALQIEIIPFF